MTDNMDRTAWSVPVQLTEVPENGLHVEFEAPDHVRTGVADLAGLRALPELKASFDVARRGTGLRVTGRVYGQVGQTCVVTLDPIESAVDEVVDLLFLPDAPEQHADEDAPEPLVDGRIDLGAIAIEFLILGVNPYPRKSGAAFEPPKSDSDGAHPFAALAALRKDKA